MKNKTVFGATAPIPSSSDDDEDQDEAIAALEDADTCSAQELEQLFHTRYTIADESAVTLKKDYILSLCADSAFTRAAAGLSNASVQIFDINSERSLRHASVDCIPAPVVSSDAAQPVSICGVRFLDETPNSLLVGSSNGQIRLYDLRTAKEVATFTEDTTCTERIVFKDTEAAGGGAYARSFSVPKPITCFDRNANSRILCAGTEQYQRNVFLLFYDVRERKQLGGYFESHEDDVTALRFHAQNPDLLVSGSDDGLINVYDIKETNEDDALLTTINAESSVQKLNWHKNVYEQDVLSCISHTDFKAYLCEEGDLIAEFEREHITAAAKRKNAANCNVINAHNLEDGSVFLLTGTNQRKGEVLRSLRLQNKQLLPLADFDGNKQIVRESVYDAKRCNLLTAGESGIVTLWTPQSSDAEAMLASDSSKLKDKTKKSKKKTPY